MIFASKTLDERTGGCPETLSGHHVLRAYTAQSGVYCMLCSHEAAPENPILVAFRRRWELVKRAGTNAGSVRHVSVDAKVELLWMKRGRGLLSESTTPAQQAHAHRVFTLLAEVSK